MRDRHSNCLISTIIPHAGGWDLLHQCLISLYKSGNVEFEVIIVENGSSERITSEQVAEFPNITVLHYDNQLGFSGACNRGVEAARGDLIFLLNNDAVVEPKTLYFLTQVFENDLKVAACQPKILSLRDKQKFDYSSACGGEIDLYGYPFARGRIFNTIESDHGQYDKSSEIFWGAGAALMMRREIFAEAGGLEELFFAHMEEIDLQWRYHLMGYKVKVEPQAVVYHLGAATIGHDSTLKLYLNHRNNLAMIFRNYAATSLVVVIPVRFVLDIVTFVFSVIRFDFRRAIAVVRALCWFFLSLPYLIKSRLQIQGLRHVKEKEILKKILRSSIVWLYFIRGRRTFSELQAIE